jgi:2,4'-dihydroxyacetophenone dioxygenase
MAVGDEPCVVHIKVTGAVEYFDEAGAVTGQADSASQRAAYLDWCREAGSDPLA